MLVIQARDPLDTFTPSLESQNDPAVWETGVPDQVENNIPILINLKDPTQLPHQKQYLLRPEAKAGLQLISKFIFHRLLRLASLPCNTPIPAVRKKDNPYGLVQDLRMINEAVFPLYPIVSSPYTLLGIVPLDSSGSALDVKDAFSPCILLDLSQFLFACHWTFPKGCLQ